MGLGAVLTLISIPIVVGLGIYNIRSLVKKAKYSEDNKFDLAIGIVIWTVAIGALIYIFFQHLPQ